MENRFRMGAARPAWARIAISVMCGLLVIPMGAAANSANAAPIAASATPRAEGGLCLASNVTMNGSIPKTVKLTSTQRKNARVIVGRGIARRLPLRAEVIAVAVARQESGLINRSTGVVRDRGLFRHREKMSAKLRIDRKRTSDRFYDRLLAVPEWQTRSVADITSAMARRVQPAKAARWETLATATVAGLVNATQLRSPAQGSAFGTGCNDGLAGYSTADVMGCSFPGIRTNPQTCTNAMRRALAEVSAPTQDWYRLCLRFVTLAYGWNGGSPTAIHMWNNMPAQFKHTGSAPAGALMFWVSGSTGHVALSMGRDQLISTDVMNRGRADLMSFTDIQTRWGLTYLGWTDPHFFNGV